MGSIITFSPYAMQPLNLACLIMRHKLICAHPYSYHNDMAVIIMTSCVGAVGIEDFERASVESGESKSGVYILHSNSDWALKIRDWDLKNKQMPDKILIFFREKFSYSDTAVIVKFGSSTRLQCMMPRLIHAPVLLNFIKINKNMHACMRRAHTKFSMHAVRALIV